jgi:hypothetical protein
VSCDSSRQAFTLRTPVVEDTVESADAEAKENAADKKQEKKSEKPAPPSN